MWNSAMNLEAFGKHSVAKRRKRGYVRRTRANAIARWEAPFVKVYVVTWRLDVRDDKTEAERRGKRHGFVSELAEMWNFRGIISKQKITNHTGMTEHGKHFGKDANAYVAAK